MQPKKAPSATQSMTPAALKFSRDEQLEKAYLGIDIKLPLTVIFLILGHREKTSFSIIKESPLISMSVSSSQNSKARVPIFFSFPKITTLLRWRQHAKALEDIHVTFFGMTMDVMEEQKNAFSQIVVIKSGICGSGVYTFRIIRGVHTNLCNTRTALCACGRCWAG